MSESVFLPVGTRALQDPVPVMSGAAAPSVLLDHPGDDTFRGFFQPERVIAAFAPDELDTAFTALEAARADGRFLAGWFSYELGHALEPRLARSYQTRPHLPLLWFAVFDHETRLAPDALKPRARAYAGPLCHDWDEDSYRTRFDRVKAYIAAGDVYQVNLSYRARFSCAGDPLALYLTLRKGAQVRHGAFVNMGKSQILSLSPELFFTLSAEGRITTRPMKGTQARSANAEDDARAIDALATCPKNRAENLMITDLLRNDLGRIARLGSVQVPELFTVETYPTLHTMVSTVTAQLKKDTSIKEITRALFPSGSVTGAPKIRAMEIIRELEEEPRGIYCGAVGSFSPDGSAAFNVAIRTIEIENGAGLLGLGGAVVQDSESTAEYRECQLKARFFDTIRRPIGLIETLRWEDGFVRAARHLARLHRSATELGLPFHEERVEAALAAAVKDACGPLRVRLSLDDGGGLDCTTAPLAPAPTVWRFAVSKQCVNSRDPLLRHKTTWRHETDAERACLEEELGVDEVLFCNERGELTEGSRSTLFLRTGPMLLTPALSSGLLPGILREELLAQGRCREAVLRKEDLARADAVFLGNSLRGLITAIEVPR